MFFSSFLGLLTGGLLSSLSAASTLGEYKFWPESASLTIRDSPDNLVIGNFELKKENGMLHAIGKAEALSLMGQNVSNETGAMDGDGHVASTIATIDYILVLFSGSDEPLRKGVGSTIMKIIHDGANPKDIEEMLKDCNAILFRCQIVHPGARQSM